VYANEHANKHINEQNNEHNNEHNNEESSMKWLSIAARRGAFQYLLIGAMLSLLPALSCAQSWPTKPIRLLVGFAPGGGTDIVARSLAPRLSELLGQPVIVENKPGASGTIAADAVAKAAADGYTLLMGHSNSNAIAPFVLLSVPYDAATDFTPITYIGYVPNILVINPGIPANTVAELVVLAKAKPGIYTYASSGIGSTQHLAGALFAQLTGTQLSHIPYKVSGGKLRALAISTPQRLPQLPDLPTFTEVGIRGFDVTNWYSVMGPKNLPKDIVAKINVAVQKAMMDASIRPNLEAQGVQFGGPTTPEEFSAFLKAELAKYQTLVKELNVKAE
jgi:tripartite-type tricarboxylate transporter receptor subunit TctC